MPENVCMPYYEPGSRVTGRATGAKVIGKRFVAIAANKDPGSRELEPDPGGSGGNIRIKPAVADDPMCFGVASHDADIGKGCAVLRGGFIVPVTAGAALTYGQWVKPGADGKAVVAATRAEAHGINLSNAALDQDAIVALYVN